MTFVKTLLIVAILFKTTSSFGFMPFAPVADIPANPNNDPDLARAISAIQQATILEDTEVGLPAYPNAQVVQTEDGKDRLLPMVRLISADNVADVAAFYKQQMSDWEKGAQDGGVLLWQGDKNGARHGEIPAIKIEKAQLFQGIPATQTEISIWYTP